MTVTPSAQYRLTIRVKLDDAQSTLLGALTGAIGEAGGMVGAVDTVEVDAAHSVRDIVVDAAGQDHWLQIIAAIEALDGVEVIDTTDRTFQLHVGGKIEQHNKHPLKTRDDLSMAYTPGVARVCLAIAEDPAKAFQYTIKRNTVAVVSDGTAVLGLGDIGPAAAMPVMEGKACLFKEFAGVDAFPICLDTRDPDEIVDAVKLIAPAFGGINLEDISAPRCFEIEERLKQELEIPVFHDDQHGTAVVVMAALLNAVKLTDRRLEDLRVLVIGLGAAGIAVTKILLAAGVRHIVGADSRGALHVRARGLPRRLDERHQALVRGGHQPRVPRRRARRRDRRNGPADRALRRTRPATAGAGAHEQGRDGLRDGQPQPRGRSPRRPLPTCASWRPAARTTPTRSTTSSASRGSSAAPSTSRARDITEEMKMAAAQAIAAIVPEEELREDYIIPSVFNRDVAPAVAAAVAEQARASGTALAGQEVGFAYGDTPTATHAAVPAGEAHGARHTHLSS